jgi:hypothetical protein
MGKGRPHDVIMNELRMAMEASNLWNPTMFIYAGALSTIDTVSGNGAGLRVRDLKGRSLQGWCAPRFHCVYPGRPPDDDDDEDDTPAEDGVERIAPPTFTMPMALPMNEAEELIATPAMWPRVPHLVGITPLPYFTDTGQLITEPGFNDESHLYYQPPTGFALPRDVPDAPDAAAVAWARDVFGQEVFCDFPFAGTADYANTMGMLLSSFVMQITRCPLPLFILTADNPGVGKSLLGETVAMILNGVAGAERFSLPEREEEIEKRITSVLISSSSPVVTWDNLTEGTSIDSRSLSTLHTAMDWSGRRLGVSETVKIPNNRIWQATGNSIGTAGDMARRSVYCALEAQGPHPEDRPTSAFRQPDIKRYVLANRPYMVLAALTLVKAWCVAGRPLPRDTCPRMGDFWPWVAAVGGILEFAGIPDFLGNYEERREGSDTGAADADALNEVLFRYFGATADCSTNPDGSYTFTAGTAAEVLRKLDDGDREAMHFPPAIDRAVGTSYLNPGDKKLAGVLGKHFRSHEGRWVGTPARRLVRVGLERKIAIYQLEQQGALIR